MKRILTIIISYNFMRWIDRCLPNLRDSDYPTDVIVVDNNSSDDTLRALRDNYPEVRVLPNKTNLGFGQANNEGIQIALNEGYDAVFLINQDAWVDKNTIRQLVTCASSHPEYGILSPIHLNGDHGQIEHGFSVYTGVKDCSSNCQEEIVTVPFINAAAWYIPIEVIKKVGTFAPLFYHYGEDKDYANRIHYFNYQIGYLPGVFACHDRAQRQISRSDFVRAESVYHLSEYANINYSFTKAFAYGILAAGKKAVTALLHGNFDNCTVYLKISLNLLLRTPEVRHTRTSSACSRSTN